MPDYSGLPSVVSASDIINHFIAFFTLFLLFERAFPRLTCKRRFIILLLYAAGIEIIQYYLPTRAAEIGDVIVDTLGLAVALLLVPYLKNRPLLRRVYHSATN